MLDRSWYGRVLVERVEGLATEPQWRRAYPQIVEYERVLAVEGLVLVKLWLHVSEDEPLRDFRAREHDPLKRWKLTGMLAETDHPAAPWRSAPPSSKPYARLRVVEIAIAAVEEALRARSAASRSRREAAL